MKTGICLYEQKSLDEEVLRTIKTAGFDGIDFCNEALFWLEENWEDRIYALRERLDRHGLQVLQVHLPWYQIFASSEEYDEKVELAIRRAIKGMAMLGVKWGTLHPMSATNYDYDAARAMEDNYRKISGYLETAVQYDVGLAIENIPIFPDCPQYSFFTHDPEDHCRLIDRFASRYVGACWDFGHANLMPYDIAAVIAQMGSRIKILHIHNNYGMYDEHLCPALGTMDWNRAIPALMKTGFDGPLSLETKLDINRSECLKSYIMFNGEAAKALLSIAENAE